MFFDGSLAKIAQVDTRATVRDAHKYNNSRISRLVARDRSSLMSGLLDRFDTAEIFALASFDASSGEDARNQLQSHIAIDLMIEGLDQRFTDSIMAEGCSTPRLFLERTLVRLPPTLGTVYSAAMIACDETPVLEKQSPEAPPSELEVQTRASTAPLLPEFLLLPSQRQLRLYCPPRQARVSRRRSRRYSYLRGLCCRSR